MKKVGLMTCYINNYGACLQAYALSKAIKNLGYTLEIVRYQGVRAYDNSMTKYIIKSIPLVPILLHKMGRGKGATYSCIKAFNKFRKNYLNFSEKIWFSAKDIFDNPPKYDILVCGSDQIWNPHLFNKNDYSVYFMDFAADAKKIAYAPSIGISEYPSDRLPELKRLVNNMDYLSVREAEGKKILETVTDKPVRHVLDPTLLLDKKEWAKIASKRLIDKPYIFCYIFGENVLTREFVEYVAGKTGLPVYTVSYTDFMRNKKYNQVENAGPAEFVSLISNAELVITDSFHATAFSINTETKFYSLLRNNSGDKNNMNSRIFSILNMVDLNERLIASKEDFPDDVLQNIDFRICSEKLATKRKEDIEYLKDALDN
ncbi:MAG: polysaccharide pyruvyl transferase family protein [Clostridiales bacterium]|jgi:hypothetical protein|nr:polysaccharide pyruvyl transferase family protein [Clostridiales bacterium]